MAGAQVTIEARRSQSTIPPHDNNFVISLDELEPNCMYMRTYRVKRDARDSDVTRPAGYTTCVPVGQFAVKRAVLRNGESGPEQNAPVR